MGYKNQVFPKTARFWRCYESPSPPCEILADFFSQIVVTVSSTYGEYATKEAPKRQEKVPLLATGVCKKDFFVVLSEHGESKSKKTTSCYNLKNPLTSSGLYLLIF